MGRSKEQKPGYGKLLDAWDPPNNAGNAIGCVATTFTFSAAFFEEECVSRLLQLETDPAEDGPVYLVEREEKLAQVTCAAALVDQHHCKGPRSLRWDMIPIRLPRGILHAKVSLLHWSNAVRVIVASANLTEDGYRRNQEVFGVLDYCPDGDAPVTVLLNIVDFLRLTLRSQKSSEKGSAEKRVFEFLDRVWKTAGSWGHNVEQHARKPLRVSAVMTMPGQQDAISKLSSIWPANNPPPWAWVTSPFFDSPDGPNKPAEALWNIMRKRGKTEITYCVEMDDVPGKDDLFARAPENLLKAKPSRESAKNSFWRLTLDPGRPFHAKTIWLEDERWVAYMIGSSNFTSPGLGLGRNPNFEANLVYVLDCDRDHKAYDKLCKVWPDYDEIKDPSKLRFQPMNSDGIDESSDLGLLPEAFSFAVYDYKNDVGFISISLQGVPPTGWQILKENGDRCISSAEWHANGSPAPIVVEWKELRPPSGFWVKWNACETAAWLPVNVASGAVLPPPEELRELPLDALIDILTSARPLHQAMRAYLSRRKTDPSVEHASASAQEIDPHRRVDTTGFLLQRTRRVSWALSGLRDRLERPVISRESLNWRLRGPVGALALKNALIKEAKSADEKIFLLLELALELDRCRPKSAQSCLPVATVRSEIRKLAGEIIGAVHNEPATISAEMQKYVNIVQETVTG